MARRRGSLAARFGQHGRDFAERGLHPTHWLIYAQVGADLLADWDNSVSKFVRVMPTDYKAVLEKMKAEEALEATAA